MKKLNLVSQLCGLALLSIGSAQAAITTIQIDHFNNPTAPLLTLSPTSEDFIINDLSQLADPIESDFLIHITPNVNNVLHLSVKPLTTGWDLIDPFTVIQGNHLGVQNANTDPVATFLDPNHDGTYDLYAGDGSTLNPDVILTTTNFGWGNDPWGWNTDNEYTLIIGLQPHVPTIPATVAFQFTGTLTAAPATVPIPAATWLMLSGLMGVLGMSKSRKQNALPA